MRISDWSSDVCSSDLLKPAPSEPAPGEVLPLTAIQVNLAGGHYLRIGLALQLVEGAEEADGSKALDAAIELFSGQKVSTVPEPEERDKLKAELTEAVREAYTEAVLEVYYTDFDTTSDGTRAGEHKSALQ